MLYLNPHQNHHFSSTSTVNKERTSYVTPLQKALTTTALRFCEESIRFFVYCFILRLKTEWSRTQRQFYSNQHISSLLTFSEGHRRSTSIFEGHSTHIFFRHSVASVPFGFAARHFFCSFVRSTP